MNETDTLNVFFYVYSLTDLTVMGLWLGVAECAAIFHTNFWLFLIPFSKNTPYFSRLPILFHLSPCSTALTVLPNCLCRRVIMSKR